jgi:hypothetical protein
MSFCIVMGIPEMLNYWQSLQSRSMADTIRTGHFLIV